MRFSILLLTVTVALSAKPIHIDLADGSAEFEWLSSAAFRLSRSWHANKASPVSSARLFESTQLRVELDPVSLNTRVMTEAGKLLSEMAGPVRGPGKILLDRKLAQDERIYGRTGATANDPFFFSSAGYGQMVRGGAKYLVDAGSSQPGRLRVTAQGAEKIDIYFLYGPNPKDIFEQRKHASPIPDTLPRRPLILDKLTCDDIRRLNAQSLSGELFYEDAGPQWHSFIGAYMREIHDRGLPTIRPLLVQFNRDPNAYKYSDVTMFGDELLIAPRCASPLTLPQGLWTDLKTDVEHKSRSTVTLTDEVTFFARNGSIVPVLRNGVVELHYFPKLGAEFFIFEPELHDYSQVHASQAADFWRLEIESKVSRTYEWVLHHIGENPKRIRVEAKAGADHILNLPL